MIRLTPVGLNECGVTLTDDKCTVTFPVIGEKVDRTPVTLPESLANALGSTVINEIFSVPEPWFLHYRKREWILRKANEALQTAVTKYFDSLDGSPINEPVEPVPIITSTKPRFMDGRSLDVRPQPWYDFRTLTSQQLVQSAADLSAPDRPRWRFTEDLVTDPHATDYVAKSQLILTPGLSFGHAEMGKESIRYLDIQQTESLCKYLQTKIDQTEDPVLLFGLKTYKYRGIIGEDLVSKVGDLAMDWPGMGEVTSNTIRNNFTPVTVPLETKYAPSETVSKSECADLAFFAIQEKLVSDFKDPAVNLEVKAAEHMLKSLQGRLRSDLPPETWSHVLHLAAQRTMDDVKALHADMDEMGVSNPSSTITTAMVDESYLDITNCDDDLGRANGIVIRSTLWDNQDPSKTRTRRTMVEFDRGSDELVGARILDA